MIFNLVNISSVVSLGILLFLLDTIIYEPDGARLRKVESSIVARSRANSSDFNCVPNDRAKISTKLITRA